MLCKDQNLLWTATIKQIEDGEYMIHYQNWSKKWDEWVVSDMLLQMNEKNLELQRDLREKVAFSGGSNYSLSLNHKYTLSYSSIPFGSMNCEWSTS